MFTQTHLARIQCYASAH